MPHCSHPGCRSEVIRARGLCAAHYCRAQRLRGGAELRLRLPSRVLAALERVAEREGVAVASLARAWLLERAMQEEEPRS